MILKTHFNHFFLAFLLLAASGYGQEENPVLSVRILEKQKPQELAIQGSSGKGGWDAIKLSRGVWTVNGKALSHGSWGTPDSTVKIKAGELTRIYPGQLTATVLPEAKGPELLILNQVPLIDYVACVTASESGYDLSQPEYLKALSAVIRGYALGHLKRHGSYDFCDLAHCQVDQGMPSHFDFWRKIAESTCDMGFLGKRPFYFNRCCGGILESASEAWGGSENGLGRSRTGPDEFHGAVLCAEDPHSHWETTADRNQLATAIEGLAALPEKAPLNDFRAVEKTSGGRNKTFAARFKLSTGRDYEILVNAQRFISEFGRLYGWRVFPSLLFEIHRDGENYRFSGRGMGHGVGLCQSGALKLARMGWNWKEILGFYFP